MGPSGSGKLTQARAWIEEAHKGKITYPMEMRTFTVGDGYEARVATSPYHFEIDIPNLSMQDKQIIGELLTTFFSSGDVLSGLRTSARKLVILRRAHSLSLPEVVLSKAAGIGGAGDLEYLAIYTFLPGAAPALMQGQSSTLTFVFSVIQMPGGMDVVR
jgi:hypothetical protein